MKKITVFAIISLLVVSPLTHGRQLRGADFIEDINILFLKENYKGLIKDTEKSLQYYRFSGKERKEVLYLMGLSYIELGKFAKAREMFHKILAVRGSKFRQDAYIGIADSYFREGKFNKAIHAYENVLHLYPGSQRLSSVYYSLGLIFKGKRDFDKADFYFQKVKEEYRTSFEADKAEYLLMREKPDYYIIQLGAFRRLKNAKKLVRKLTRKGYDSYIQKVKKDSRVFYRVRGGKFSNKYYAMRLLGKLKKGGFSARIIVE